MAEHTHTTQVLPNITASTIYIEPAGTASVWLAVLCDMWINHGMQNLHPPQYLRCRICTLPVTLRHGGGRFLHGQVSTQDDHTRTLQEFRCRCTKSRVLSLIRQNKSLCGAVCLSQMSWLCAMCVCVLCVALFGLYLILRRFENVRLFEW